MREIQEIKKSIKAVMSPSEQGKIDAKIGALGRASKYLENISVKNRPTSKLGILSESILAGYRIFKSTYSMLSFIAGNPEYNSIACSELRGDKPTECTLEKENKYTPSTLSKSARTGEDSK